MYRLSLQTLILRQPYYCNSFVGTILDGLNLTAHPESVWNCDEMAKNFEHNPGKVVGQKGESCIFRTSSKSSNITVMACVNAAGEKMPPMFVVKGKTSRSLHGFNTIAAPEGSKWDYQVNGWMNDELGEKWFQQVFLEHCGPQRPQLIILDVAMATRVLLGFQLF